MPTRQLLSLITFLMLSCSSVSLIGCTQLARFGIGTTPISQIVSNPSQYQNATIRGKVINQIGVLGRGAYEIQDNSASVWVVTQSGMPPINSTVTVRGRASEGISIGGLSIAVTLTEQERL
ncbi:hypothetical protein DO97_13225 [Neosynechococcus sphagnicola sy1]|uniref:DNA-binding protein n=1 Tax=Neosynechococcus sphagnicola sy1 TaxID=1497020 RepID=A0A098TMJ2_9CYAN|nr:hypothetical protein [Neosynechococcus sphagnicola]KGF72063.1 hypothetical protein DO97_13225 [Neosynechococcus sphagnicola sy1]